MKRSLIVFGIIACSIFAIWAYSMSGRTRVKAAELREIERQIVKEHETIKMLRAEWAYLNRPERLRHLVEMNFAKLGLMQISPSNYGDANMVPYPASVADGDMPYIDPAEIEEILADVMKEEASYP